MRIGNRLFQFIIYFLVGFTILAAKERFSEDLFKALKYRNIGPFRGGRSAAATGVPGKTERIP